MIRLMGISMSAVLAMSAGFSALADDITAQQKLEEAKALYAQREDLAKNDAVIAALAEAEAQAENTELKYDILILASRALYWKGGHSTKKAEKMTNYEAGYGKAEVARKLNDTYADAYYFYAINLGKWGLAKGIDASILSRAEEGERYVNGAIARKTKDGNPGESIDGFGPYRTLGKMHLELSKIPFQRKWKKDKALEILEKAYANARNLALNAVYLGDTLFRIGGDANQARARAILTDLIANDPATFNPARVPETKEEFEEARQVLEANS